MIKKGIIIFMVLKSQLIIILFSELRNSHWSTNTMHFDMPILSYIHGGKFSEIRVKMGLENYHEHKRLWKENWGPNFTCQIAMHYFLQVRYLLIKLLLYTHAFAR